MEVLDETVLPGDASPMSLGLHLLYHEVRPEPAEYSYAVDAATFHLHLDALGRLQETAARPFITFDDGHISNFDMAAPALEEGGFSAYFFITAGWTGTRPGYMDWGQVRELHRAGHRIGSHGWSHRLLTHCGDADLKDELVRSRGEVEDKLGVPVTTISLPGGRADRRVFKACQAAGYIHVFSSEPRTEALPLPFVVGRVNVMGTMDAKSIAALFRPNSPALARLHRRHQAKSALKAVLGDRLYERLWASLNRSEFDPATERNIAR